jgi:signal transduction histidine kinase
VSTVDPPPFVARSALMLATLIPGVAGLAVGTFAVGAALTSAGELGATAIVPLAALSLPVLALLLWLLGVRATHLHRMLTVDAGAGPPWRWTLAAREGERHRLQRDLHDGIGPALAGLRLRLDKAAAGLTHEPDAQVLVVDAAAEASRVMDEVRRIINDLRPLDLESVGLTDGIRALAQRVGVGDTSVLLDLPPHAPVMSPGTEIAAYRIVSECLTNAVRHSGARNVTVRMIAETDHLVVEVGDDGRGLLIPAGGGDATGLTSIAQRAEEIGGRCTILSRPGAAGGTLVRTLLPRFLP